MLSLLAIFKNETLNLDIWIRHYQWQKVNHIYLIDNGSTDEPLCILQKYIDQGYVTYLYLDEKYAQTKHYATMYEMYIQHDSSKWVMVCDLDEFFYGTQQPLADALKSMEHYDIIYSPWWMFGSENLEDHPADIRTAIVHRQPDYGTDLKYIFKKSALTFPLQLSIHCLRQIQGIEYEVCLEDRNIRLNHYPIQSRHFFYTVKMNRGDATDPLCDSVRDWTYFDKYNQDMTVCDTLLSDLVKNGYPAAF
jgi:hypothetical protein